MTSKDLWQQYQHYTQDFTGNARKLGIGGIAACWLFRDANYLFPPCIYLALLFFVLYFICDILHSVGGALSIKFFAERKEKELWEKEASIEGEISKPRAVDRIAFCMFLAKASALLIGFACIGIELFYRMK